MSEKKKAKQMFELMLTQQLWAFDDEDFERMWLVFVNTFSEILQQKPLKLKYLTEKETEMSDAEINLQVALGLRSCETLGDVCKLLDDVRVCERKRLLDDLEKE